MMLMCVVLVSSAFCWATMPGSAGAQKKGSCVHACVSLCVCVFVCVGVLLLLLLFVVAKRSSA